MSYEILALQLLFLPLASFVILGLWGKTIFKKASGMLGTVIMTVVTLYSLWIAYRYFGGDGLVNGVWEAKTLINFGWLPFANEGLAINFGILLDGISVMMLVVISVVSLMVHIFSLWYMKGEDRFSTYYAYLGLFTFSMLGLVLSSNLFQMYIFWELVGVSSYLLISYYFIKSSAVAAGKKAFIVTRFADFFFLIGILIIGVQVGSFDFRIILERLTGPEGQQFVSAAGAGFLGVSTLTWALALIFIGGAGKSAMFPLHIWLPDAMEGPTPVSALIHAATMVVAGVYLVARLFPVFHFDGASLDLVAWVGVFTALFAAVIACTQMDIKRVLAYSTMSQIGFMMFALGVSGFGSEAGLGYTASMFHLFTHAFFKSLLFLGAGAIIHFVHSNDMQNMGNLRKYLPVTHISFLIACLAIAGVPPLSGFFSKENILLAAYENNKAIYFIALFTAGLTAFYMFRLYFSIFWNQRREYHAQSEGNFFMKFPLITLMILSIVAGFVPFSQYVVSDGVPFDTAFHLLFSIAPVALVALGIGLAWMIYKNPTGIPAKLRASLGGFYRGAYNKFYIDEIYQFVTHKILMKGVGQSAASFDDQVVNGMVNQTGEGTQKISEILRDLQSGHVQRYALWFLGGIAMLAIIIMYL